MKVTVGAATDIGQVREGNEDSYLLLDPLYAVADGMGGHRGGEVASSLALETVKELFSAGDGSLTEQVERANRAVYERSRSDREVQGMGTTLTAVVVQGAKVRLAHVGDSRGYLLRDGKLHMLTKDHTLVARMVEDGEITEAEAETHPHRSIVTRALGVDAAVQVDEGILDVRDGDRLLLCSDGLTGMLSHDGIEAILRDVSDPKEAVDRLVSAANEAGGVDNITAVLLDFSGDGTEREDTGTAATAAEVKAPDPEATTMTPAVPARERDDITVIGRPIPRPEDRPPPEPPSRARAAAGRAAGTGSSAVRKASVGAGVVLVLIALGLVGLRLFLDSQWYVGISNDRVAIFRGAPTEVAGFQLHSVVVETAIPASQVLPLGAWRELPNGITASDRAGAEAIVDQIRQDVAGAQPDRS